jgi:thiosulfate reductase cytochrome b subunit
MTPGYPSRPVPWFIHVRQLHETGYFLVDTFLPHLELYKGLGFGLLEVVSGRYRKLRELLVGLNKRNKRGLVDAVEQRCNSYMEWPNMATSELSELV